MILVFCILVIIICICLINLILKLSNIKIEIEDLHIFNANEEIKIEFLINVSVYLLNKMKLINIKIDKNRIINKINLKNITFNKKENKEFFKKILKIKYQIEYFKIEGYFSTFNSVLTSNIFSIIQIIIPLLLRAKLNKKYVNNLKFLNLNQNTINVKINCIITTKLVNIINILHLKNKNLKNMLKEKKGGIKTYGRTSNRRINAYCNE